jgi:hypothetical protein
MIAWLLLALAVVYALVRVFAGYPRPKRPCTVLSRREMAFLDAAGEATFPPGGAIDASGGEVDLAIYTDRWLTVMHPRMRLLMRMLFFLVEHATLFLPAPGPRGWRRFSSLLPEQRVAVLDGWRTSRLYARRIVFVSLRAILTMGYFAHPPVLRQLNLAPRAVETPLIEADLLYPPIGRGPEAIAHERSDLRPASLGAPLDATAPVDPRFLEGAP